MGRPVGLAAAGLLWLLWLLVAAREVRLRTQGPEELTHLFSLQSFSSPNVQFPVPMSGDNLGIKWENSFKIPGSTSFKECFCSAPGWRGRVWLCCWVACWRLAGSSVGSCGVFHGLT